jgi:hypothetical protein
MAIERTVRTQIHQFCIKASPDASWDEPRMSEYSRPLADGRVDHGGGATKQTRPRACSCRDAITTASAQRPGPIR